MGFGAIPRGVLELLDVGVVDLKAKLVQFGLDIVDNLVAEDAALLEELPPWSWWKTMLRVSPSMMPLTMFWTWLRLAETPVMFLLFGAAGVAVTRE